MTKGRPSHRSKRPRGWLSGRKTSGRRGTPLWQWIVFAPVVLALLVGIALFAYLTMFNPRMGAGARSVTVPVLERVETRTSGGALDTSASYLVVSVDGAPLRLAPRLPDWDQVAKGDLVDVEVAGTGPAIQALSWRAAPKLAPTPPAGDPSPVPAPR